MKTEYIIPQITVVKLKTRSGILLSTSETEVSGDNGGWVKEDVTNSSSTTSSNYNVWKDDWRQ